MSQKKFSDEEVLEIQKMTFALRAKMEYAFPRPYDELLMAEIKALRASLENMSFVITWEAALDAATGQIAIDITLWLRKEPAN